MSDDCMPIIGISLTDEVCYEKEGSTGPGV